jgi:hypothetical protein
MTEQAQTSDVLADEYDQEIARQHDAAQEQADLVATFYRRLLSNGISIDSAAHFTGCYILAAAADLPQIVAFSRKPHT